jgi:hypothetical protein
MPDRERRAGLSAVLRERSLRVDLQPDQIVGHDAWRGLFQAPNSFPESSRRLDFVNPFGTFRLADSPRPFILFGRL